MEVSRKGTVFILAWVGTLLGPEHRSALEAKKNQTNNKTEHVASWICSVHFVKEIKLRLEINHLITDPLREDFISYPLETMNSHGFLNHISRSDLHKFQMHIKIQLQQRTLKSFL